MLKKCIEEYKKEVNKMRLEGKVCIVTGGARGLGRAMVERFAE
ncbi:NADP-dependent 3-hydroxy acid dehydrogenase YdfG, partial [Marinitoga litoralis]|nr:NADP-dependent 3-hydroxy acid dehydrogenase YdfG [Marinitoga litoralis]